MQTNNNPGSLKEKFGNFGAAPTEQLWDSISSTLDQNKKKRRGIFWWWFTGIAASGILLFGIYQLGYVTGKNENNLTNENINSISGDAETNLSENNVAPFQSNISDQNAVESEHGTVTGNEDTDINTVNELPLIGMTDSKLADDPKLTTPKSNNEIKTEKDIATIPVDMEQQKTSEIPNEKLTLLNLTKIKKIETEQSDIFNLADAPAFEKIQKKGQWEIGISAGMQTTFKPSEQFIPTSSNNLSMDFLGEENLVQGTGVESFNTISPSTVSIYRPLSVDFSIARRTGYRWTIQSGIGINFIKAETRYDSYDLIKVNTSFFSLSVPLLAKYDFIKRKRMEFSASLGVVNEFPFYSSTSKTFNPALENSEVKSKSLTGGYMCSVMTSIGFGYRLNEKIKIGLYPNVRRYVFQSLKSEYPVLERKLWVGASVGLTWNL